MEHLTCARMAFQEKRYYDCIELYSRVAVLESEGEIYREALLKIAVCYYRLQIFDIALDRYKKLIKFDYNSEEKFEILNMIAIIYGQLGLYNESLKRYTSLLNIAQNNSQMYKAYVGLGLNNYLLGKEMNDSALFIEANNNYNLALKYSTDDQKGVIWNNMALILQEKNEHETAIKYFEKAEVTFATNKRRKGQLLNYKALSLLFLEKNEQAMNLLNQSEKILTEVHDLVELGRNEKIRGMWFKRNGDIYQALHHFKSAAKILKDKNLYKEIAEISYLIADISKQEHSNKYLTHLLEFVRYVEKMKEEENGGENLYYYQSTDKREV